MQQSKEHRSAKKFRWQDRNVLTAALIGILAIAATYGIFRLILRAGTPQSGALPPNSLTPTPYTLTDGVTKYCVTRTNLGPAESYFIPNKSDTEFNAFKNANLPGVTVTPAPAAGSNWVAGACSSSCNVRDGTEADGNCGTRAATRTDTSCTNGCTVPTPNPCCSSCGSGQYMCQYDSSWACYTMCCTGNGCPSWACTSYCSTHGGVKTYCSPPSLNTCTCNDNSTYNCSGDTCAYC